MNDFAHSKSGHKTLCENIRNAGNLRERNGTNENDWVCGCVKQCIASFLYFASSFPSGKTRIHIFSATDITSIFVIFCLIERLETIPFPCWKVSNVLSKEIFPCNIEYVFLLDSLIMYFLFYILWNFFEKNFYLIVPYYLLYLIIISMKM